jgi:hypothetical protein
VAHWKSASRIRALEKSTSLILKCSCHVGLVKDGKRRGCRVSATRYKLSFTSGGLLVREATRALPLYLELRDWPRVRAHLDETNALQARTVASGRRVARELVQRLAELTDQELELLREGREEERGHLMWVAACRRYTMIGEFAEEVVRERFLLMTATVIPEDFDAFVRSKSLWHEELADLAPSTLRKLRTNLFLMLREAALMSEAGHVVQPLMSNRLLVLLDAREPSDLRFFPVPGRLALRGAS